MASAMFRSNVYWVLRTYQNMVFSHSAAAADWSLPRRSDLLFGAAISSFETQDAASIRAGMGLRYTGAAGRGHGLSWYTPRLYASSLVAISKHREAVI